VPITACVFALIVSPLSFCFYPSHTSMEADYQARIFWPVIAAVSVILTAQNSSRLGRFASLPHVLCLFACLAFAGASVTWAGQTMPNAHNGYYDTTLEMGYVGYWLVIACVIATRHAIGRIAYRDSRRAWLVLSLPSIFCVSTILKACGCAATNFYG
jgi:hypothetical protein